MIKVDIEKTTMTLEEFEKLLALHDQLLLIATEKNDLRMFLQEKISVETLTKLIKVFNYQDYKDKYYLIPGKTDSISDLYWYLKAESTVYVSAFA